MTVIGESATSYFGGAASSFQAIGISRVVVTGLMGVRYPCPD
jgi:hypothetical protein